MKCPNCETETRPYWGDTYWGGTRYYKCRRCGKYWDSESIKEGAEEKCQQEEETGALPKEALTAENRAGGD